MENKNSIVENENIFGIVEKVEKEFDWNLVFLISTWMFLLITGFLIFI